MGTPPRALRTRSTLRSRCLHGISGVCWRCARCGVDDASPAWSVLAREAERDGGLDRLYRGEVVETSRSADSTRDVPTRGLAADLARAQARVDSELELAERAGGQLVTVLDDGYPANLRLIADRPPFLFVRGRLHDDDARAVAVVGTRRPSPEGLTRADKMAARLAEEQVTVASGIAAGIDTAAHRAALDAGGRTVAVIGTGIARTYPKENHALAEEIAERAAVVSQFWPHDDVCTTALQLEMLARRLRSTGAATVCAVVLARAPFRS